MSSASHLPSAIERELLDAARGGDEDAYRQLVESHRGELHAHCYRMLGSLHDAEDALQEALLRAWRGLPRFEGRSSLRTWLYRLATNTSLDTIARRPKRVLPAGHGPPADPTEPPAEPLVESVWIEPYPDERLAVEDGYAAPEARFERRESLELAFIAAVQLLPARQRAVLILREVLGYSAAEAAETLDASVPAVNSALQRARRTVEDHLPEHSQQATLRTLGDDGLRDMVERYMTALESDDVSGIVDMLTEDAAWSMPPLASWYRGLPDVREFLARGPLSGDWRWRHIPTQANGQVAVAGYTWSEADGCFRPFCVDVLTLRGDRIAEVCAFVWRTTAERDPDDFSRWPDDEPDARQMAGVFAHFGLPDRLD